VAELIEQFKFAELFAGFGSGPAQLKVFRQSARQR
jgi:hypothetical protein